MNHSRVRYGRIALSFIIAFILHPSSFILPEAARAQVDTIRASARHAAVPDTGEFHMTKSPLEAVLLSVVIPGAGQVYLEQTWKLPFIYGLIGGFFYGALIQNTRYLYTQDTINNANARRTAGDSAWAQENVPVREFYRDDRDKWWIFIGIAYIANVLDAYIAANLYDFDVSNPAPSPIMSYYNPDRREYGLAFRIRF